jgi:hypothetical protein
MAPILGRIVDIPRDGGGMPGGKLETAAGSCDLLRGLHEPNLLECFSSMRNFSLRRESFAVYVDSVLFKPHRRIPLYAVGRSRIPSAK